MGSTKEVIVWKKHYEINCSVYSLKRFLFCLFACFYVARSSMAAEC